MSNGQPSVPSNELTNKSISHELGAAINSHPPNSAPNNSNAGPSFGSSLNGTAGQPSVETAEIEAKFALIASFLSLRDVLASVDPAGRNANKMNRCAPRKLTFSKNFLKNSSCHPTYSLAPFLWSEGQMTSNEAKYA